MEKTETEAARAARRLREERELDLGREDLFALILSGLVTILPVVLLILRAIFAVVYLFFLR